MARKIETLEYTLPACWACALINDDRSGLEDQDEAELDRFLKSEQTEGRRFACIAIRGEQYFAHSNDAGTLAGDVLDFVFDISKIEKPVRKNYYQVSGKNKHIPFMYYVSAETIADAKILFYANTDGTDINYIIRITKVQFEKAYQGI